VAGSVAAPGPRRPGRRSRPHAANPRPPGRGSLARAGRRAAAPHRAAASQRAAAAAGSVAEAVAAVARLEPDGGGAGGRFGLVVAAPRSHCLGKSASRRATVADQRPIRRASPGGPFSAPGGGAARAGVADGDGAVQLTCVWPGGRRCSVGRGDGGRCGSPASGPRDFRTDRSPDAPSHRPPAAQGIGSGSGPGCGGRCAARGDRWTDGGIAGGIQDQPVDSAAGPGRIGPSGDCAGQGSREPDADGCGSTACGNRTDRDWGPLRCSAACAAAGSGAAAHGGRLG
jgi:hypothetical protein